MRLFRRRKPLHVQLAEKGGLLAATAVAPQGLIAEPPGWDGEQRGEPGIHGVPRARRWDAVVSADVPGLRGDTIEFVTLPDGSLLCESDEPDEGLAKLAEAVEEQLRVPYRAEAVRRGPETWAVGARRISVVDVHGLRGDEAELVAVDGARTLKVDGQPTVQAVPELQRAGEALSRDFAVRARRLDGSLWEVEASAL